MSKVACRACAHPEDYHGPLGTGVNRSDPCQKVGCNCAEFLDPRIISAAGFKLPIERNTGCYYCGKNCHDDATDLWKRLEVYEQANVMQAKRIDKLRQYLDALARAAETILEGFERGKFLRDTTGDGSPRWALEFVPYLKAMGDAAGLIQDIKAGTKS